MVEKLTTNPSIEELETEIHELKEKLHSAYQERDTVDVPDYKLTRSNGETVHLTELFGVDDELIVVHNMGKSCPYCTMWADGFNGLYKHIEDRAAFVVCSPDSPEDQAAFAKDRGWKFDMVSGEGSTFIEDLGFTSDDRYEPGVSTFFKDDQDEIQLIAQRQFGPFDDYCPVWNLFGILKNGVDEWHPKFEY